MGAFDSVNPGDQRKGIPAMAWNTLMRIARDYNAGKLGGGNSTRNRSGGDGLALIKNASGADVVRFGVLGIDSVVFSPTDNLDAFKNSPILSCTTPATPDHLGKFAIPIEPIASGKMGLALVNGVGPAQIDITNTAHEFADVSDADAEKLTSGPVGAAKILWAESGTGTKWAIVQLGFSRSERFEVDLSTDGGDDGDSTTAPSYTYTVSKDGTDLGTEKEPETGRNIGSFVAATKGEAYYNSEGVLTLFSAEEKENVVVCGT